MFFFQTSWKDGLSKKIVLEYDLSRIIGKDHVSLSRKCDLNLRRKMKDDLFQKNTRKHDIFFRSSEKMVFSKRAAPGHDLSCIIWKDGFFPKTWYFFLGQQDDPWAVRWPWCHLPASLGRKMTPAMTLPKKYMEIWYLLCARVGVINMVSRPPANKNQGWPYPAKIHLKVIDVLDWHPGKSSSNSLYLHRDLFGRFHVLVSSEKNRGT